MIKVSRIYDQSVDSGQYKVFVDRLWPRGISKEKASWNEWMKEVAPSDELRKWYNHDHEKWSEFKLRYKEELGSKTDLLKKLKMLEKEHCTLTLLYSSKEEKYNNAYALKEILDGFSG
ncbi:MAG TPA: DUF488 family protein [Bacteroidales bacterium]|jgi:uncharacterized protein YeaO (DUF488 family)|nr:DUF488 family protein [Bacteroidales bacterium]